jgi:phage FluMu protein Com
MTNIIDFKAKQIEYDAHLSGDARCLCCGHEWVAAAPVGVTELECPECRTMKGVYIGMTAPEVVFECTCGNQHFFIDPDGVMCAICGNRPNLDE